MSRQLASSAQQRHSRAEAERYLIRLAVGEEERHELWELGRNIQRLGGVEMRDGYAFPSRQLRDEALEVLIEHWGGWYFESPNVADEGSPRILLTLPCDGPWRVMGEYLRRRGFSAEIAHDASHCLEMLRIHRPHVLVLDHELPWCGGDRILAGLQEDLHQLAIPVLLLVDDPLERARWAQPVIGTLSHPVEPHRLFEALTEKVPDLLLPT